MDPNPFEPEAAREAYEQEMQESSQPELFLQQMERTVRWRNGVNENGEEVGYIYFCVWCGDPLLTFGTKGLGNQYPFHRVGRWYNVSDGGQGTLRCHQEAYS